MQVNYNKVQKILHEICLGNKFIKKSLFELETLIFKNSKKFDNVSSKNIFITSLPRSGTTTILNMFYDSDEYSSLTYNDLPFLMSPNLGKFLFNKKSSTEFMRPHNDGIKYSINSPEALDEVFLSTYNKEEILENFSQYINLIKLKYEKKNYLSKNNNNFNRIDLINSKIKNCFFFIPFRDPIQHANSLMTQNKNFFNLQNKDNFILKYMNYLGHYEFGKNHKSWNIPKKFIDIKDINYWLEQWLLFYKKILIEIKKFNNIYLINYENLCKDKKSFFYLLDSLKIKYSKNHHFKNTVKDISINYEKEIYDECYKLYFDLSEISKNYIK